MLLDSLLNLLAFESSEADLRSDRRNVEVDGQNNGCSCEVRWFPVKELTISLHILAELSSSEANLLEIMIHFLLIKVEYALESLNEGQWSCIMN